MENRKVIIVGAGIGGLAAGYWLRQRGYEVEILEASDRPGGRIGLTFDFLPSVGRTGKHDNIYYSMGYNGHGVAFSQLAGQMIA